MRKLNACTRGGGFRSHLPSASPCLDAPWEAAVARPWRLPALRPPRHCLYSHPPSRARIRRARACPACRRGAGLGELQHLAPAVLATACAARRASHRPASATPPAPPLLPAPRPRPDMCTVSAYTDDGSKEEEGGQRRAMRKACCCWEPPRQVAAYPTQPHHTPAYLDTLADQTQGEGTCRRAAAAAAASRPIPRASWASACSP